MNLNRCPKLLDQITSPPPIAYPDFTILGVGDELVLKKSNGLGLGYVVKVNSY